MNSEHKLSLCGGAVTEVRAGNLQSQIGSGFRNMQQTDTNSTAQTQGQ